MAHACGHANDDLFAKMLASQAAGQGALPPGLGLRAEAFGALLARHFPGFGPLGVAAGAELDPVRASERSDLVGLMLEGRAGSDPSEVWLAEIVAAACMAGDHLWQDLGLWSRKDLSRLMADNFPHLAALNDRDMKWKKFLYRQICDREGIPVCPAPSCQSCTDYAKCFESKE
ncbi:nitrogen fixation protein NifQ [Parasulfuritortus cantonensis]|uniref:Nitrogen fixation protein NifQ n=1 Tax=Parasulfuritortus cantonensis TaxID=2528202 RepID=A0A4R1B774_9PROT|nr:nitrogen fixation protein NifQ [Parasulfuritortus cantonensis]TCJ11533.1 nitrogen fixation protein NifQ [Parasulfuritortus cantonensis]